MKEPCVKEPDKCEEIKWFSINELPENMIDNGRIAIQNSKNHIFYSEFGWNNKGG